MDDVAIANREIDVPVVDTETAGILKNCQFSILWLLKLPLLVRYLSTTAFLLKVHET